MASKTKAWKQKIVDTNTATWGMLKYDNNKEIRQNLENKALYMTTKTQYRNKTDTQFQIHG